ncbi:MAG: VCBS domain-containing protein, partial [Rhizobiales bacterium]|nr:VCBS domain-containing protein [Hyphomicrobiales bacterium]
MANYTGTSGVDNVDVGSGSTNSADIINTYNGNDIVKAGGGNDVVDLGAGDDIVTGGAGNDTLRGGTGTDTAIFSGVWADYTITQNANGSFTVLDNRPGSPDGRDTLWSIEVFRFAAPGGSGTVDVPWTDVVLRDAPTASLIGADSNSAALDETNAPLTATGTLTVRDADVADTVTAAVQSVSASGPLGALTNPQLLAMFGVAPTGTGTSPLTADPTETSNLTWNFASTPIAFDYLATGQTLTLTYTITLTDTLSGLVTPTTVNITITGTNDAPTLGTVTAGSVAEDDQASTTTDTGLTGTLVGADVDGDTLT